jgi:hypothetical protein
MARISNIARLVAGVHFAALASPSLAFAQEAQEPPAAPLTARLPPANAMAGAQVWVHLEGSEVAELQQDKVGDHRHWVTVCTAPCDTAVPSEFSYRIAGDGIRNSRVFTLHSQGSDRETISVDEGSKGAFVGGILGASVGLLFLSIGLVVLLVNAAASEINGAEGGSGQGDGSTESVGVAFSVLGLVGMIAGVVVLASNARTKVTQGSAASPAAWLPPTGWASAAGVLGVNGAFKDAFKDARRDSGWAAALPPMIGVPLFRAQF